MISDSPIADRFALLDPLFHRLLTPHNARELEQVRASGYLWGYAPRLGPLPEEAKGFTFRIDVRPTRKRPFFGVEGAERCEGTVGVESVSHDGPDMVRIRAEIVATGAKDDA